MTFRHYFVYAASLCSHYGGDIAAAACQTLANLCALQLFDITSEACVAHLDVINSRGSSNGYTNDINNWVNGNPWLYFTLPPTAGLATSPCLANIYRAYLRLNSYLFAYSVAVYTMNGTFSGYKPLSTLFSYCGRQPPYTSDGGGTSSNTKYQMLGYPANLNFTCELGTLLGTEQLFYELYLLDRRSRNAVPVPVRVLNMYCNIPLTTTYYLLPLPNASRTLSQSSGGVQVNEKYPRFLCDNTDILVRRFFLYDIVSGSLPPLP